MKRRTLDILFSLGGIALAALFLILGLVMTSNANFSKKYVRDQLRQQQINFKAADTLTAEEKKAPCLVQYAGQQLETGKQAECNKTNQETKEKTTNKAKKPANTHTNNRTDATPLSWLVKCLYSGAVV